jgi:hypothetical protein
MARQINIQNFDDHATGGFQKIRKTKPPGGNSKGRKTKDSPSRFDKRSIQ